MSMSMSRFHEVGILVSMSMSQLTTLVSEFMKFWRFVVILRDRVREIWWSQFVIFREPVSIFGGVTSWAGFVCLQRGSCVFRADEALQFGSDSTNMYRGGSLNVA